jgi:L-serine dehydratase
MTGASLGAGRILVTEINGYAVEVSGAYHTIVLIAEDVKGSIAAIATILAEHGINIANLRLDAETARRRRVHGHRGRRRAGRARARRDSRLALGTLGLQARQGQRLMYRALADAIRDAEQQGISLARLALETEAKDQGRTVDDIRAALRRALDVMRGAVERGMVGDLHSASGLVGGDAAKLRNGPPGPLAGTPFRDVLARALAVQEVNAAMGVIVAAPTAGGAGVLPAVLTGLAQARGIADDAVVDALAVAGLIGAVIAERASLSGAEGGCQAETGAAAAMAAGAATEMLGGTPAQVGHATALAMQGTLGLVCDPLGGLVELPCVFATPPGRRSRSPASSSPWPASSSRSPSTRSSTSWARSARRWTFATARPPAAGWRRPRRDAGSRGSGSCRSRSAEHLEAVAGRLYSLDARS